ncbi:hypothetical protein LINPERHAP2_LOCUS43969 [Linum perenne]
MLVKVKSEAKFEEPPPPPPVVAATGKNSNGDEKKGSSLRKDIVIPENPEAVFVDVVSLTSAIAPPQLQQQQQDLDATEHSSSFADTLSETDRCLFGGNSEEGEVESEFFGAADADLDSPFDAFSSLFYSRKKKVTNHWRSFIRPLMWRCKWAELKIREIESQALKYSGELTTYEHSKQSSTYQSIPEGFCSKSIPFLNECYRRKSKRRRRRKRVEEAVDMSSIVSDHPIFSYLESKRSAMDGASLVDDFEPIASTDTRPDGKDRFGDSIEGLPFAFGDSTDNCLETMLLNIEASYSLVHKLKDQLDLAITNSASKFSSWDNLCLLAPCEGQTSSAPSPVLSVGYGGETLSPGARYNTTQQHTSGCDMSDMALPESAMSSFGEAVHVPDIIESTVKLLSGPDVTFHEQPSEDMMIKKEAMDHNTEREAVMGTSCNKVTEEGATEKGEIGESKDAAQVQNLKTEEVEASASAAAGNAGESNLKSCLALDMQIPTNKRKRGERKAGSGTGGWKKKCSGFAQIRVLKSDHPFIRSSHLSSS